MQSAGEPEDPPSPSLAALEADGWAKNRVKAQLDIFDGAFHDSYLGMPKDVGRSTTTTFKFLPDRAWQNIHG